MLHLCLCLCRQNATLAAQGLERLDADDGTPLGEDGLPRTTREARRSGELRTSKGLILGGVPAEDVAMTLCHVALVHQQMGRPAEAIAHFSRALALREGARVGPRTAHK